MTILYFILYIQIVIYKGGIMYLTIECLEISQIRELCEMFPETKEGDYDVSLQFDCDVERRNVPTEKTIERRIHIESEKK